MTAPSTPPAGLLRVVSCMGATTLGFAVGAMFMPWDRKDAVIWIGVVILGFTIGSLVGLLVWLAGALARRCGLKPAGPEMWVDDAVRLFIITSVLTAGAGVVMSRGILR